jgi:hypothetical protein
VEPSGPANGRHPALPSLPSFRLASVRRGRAAVPLRSFASGVLGTTAGAVPELGLSDRRAADAPANRTKVISSLPSATTFSGFSGMRATPDASWESQCRRQAMGTLTEASAFAAAYEAGLEERIADILERAATDAGIDLP